MSTVKPRTAFIKEVLMKLMRSSTLILPIMSVLSALTVCSVSAQSEKLNYDTVIATWQPQQLSIVSIDEAEKF